MLKRGVRWVATVIPIAGAMLVLMAASAAAQVADTVVHRGSHGMSWGRETFVLSEVLEYGPALADRAVDYDLVAWTGGAVNRLWAKVDGGVATRGSALHGEYQLLYGRLVSPWWDAQLGLRVDQRRESASTAARVGAEAMPRLISRRRMICS
jgi:uncharacterized protein involved in copper resistance